MTVDEAIKIVKEMKPEERGFYLGIREALFWNGKDEKAQRIPWDAYIPGTEEYYLDPKKFYATLVEHAADDGGWMWYWKWEIISGEICIELRCSESEKGFGDWTSEDGYYPEIGWFDKWSLEAFVRDREELLGRDRKEFEELDGYEGGK